MLLENGHALLKPDGAKKIIKNYIWYKEYSIDGINDWIANKVALVYHQINHQEAATVSKA